MGSASSGPARLCESPSVGELAQKPQDFEVEPDQRDDQAEGAYHSMYLGASEWAQCSMKSKSRSKLKAASPTTKRLKPIPGSDELKTSGMCTPKKPSKTVIK